MDEDHRPQLLGLGPERPQPLVAQLDAVNVRGDDDAAQIEVANTALELGGRERHVVQRQRAEPDQPVGVARDGLGHAIVAEPLHFERLLGLHPVAALLHDAGADHLDVDAGRIHLREPQRRLGHALEQRLRDTVGPSHRARVLRLLVGRLHHFRHEDVGMHVNDGRLRGRRAGAARCLGRLALGLLPGAARGSRCFWTARSARPMRLASLDFLPGGLGHGEVPGREGTGCGRKIRAGRRYVRRRDRTGMRPIARYDPLR